MTKEEKIRGLYSLKECLVENPIELEGHKSLPITLIDYAIEALEQSSTPDKVSSTAKENLAVDCISREATVKRLCNLAEFMNEHKENSGDPYIMAALFIQDNKTEFPSVTPQEPRWIPVSERLPEENGGYLITLKGGYVMTALWNGNDGYWSEVTAWMQLPKPFGEVET